MKTKKRKKLECCPASMPCPEHLFGVKKHKHRYDYPGTFYCKGCSLCPGHIGSVKCRCGKRKP